MRHGLYAIRDKCAAAFLPPFSLPMDAMAVREFARAANMDDHKFGTNAEDFSLYKLGHYEDDSGVIAPFPEPQFLIAAIQCKKPKADPEEGSK